MDFKSFINEQQEPHIVERSGLPYDERYFIGWKKDLPHMANSWRWRQGYTINDVFADGQYGTYKDAVKFPSKEAAEEVVARIEKEDKYNVYASPLED